MFKNPVEHHQSSLSRLESESEFNVRRST